jgi:hypothetical protein
MQRAERERKRIPVTEGLRLQRDSASNATAAVASWEAERGTLDKEMQELDRVRADHKARRDELMAQADPRKKAAVDERLMLFSDDFESSTIGEGWHLAEGGSAHIVDDTNAERGKVLAFRSCTWGGDVFSSDLFACSPSSKCWVSFWARGAPWQGFSLGAKRTEKELEDAHSWLAVPASNTDFEDRLLTTQTTKDWAHYEYQFPTSDTFQMFGSEDVRYSSSDTLHIMLQAHGSTGSCDETRFDDIRVRRATNVIFIDGDGDEIEFSVNLAGGVDLYVNKELYNYDIDDVHAEENRLVAMGVAIRFKEGEEYLKDEVIALFNLVREESSGSETATDDVAKKEQAVEDEASPEAEADEAVKTPEVSEYAKWALKEQEEKKNDGQVAETPEANPPAEELHAEEEQRPEANATELELQVSKAKTDFLDADKKYLAAKDQYFAVDNHLRRVGEGNRWFLLVNSCVEKRIDGFNYKICFFATATQDGITLGQFESWDEKNLVMSFKQGTMCPIGPRELKVKLVCGSQADITGLTEPSMCVYDAEVIHPSACSEDDLRALDDKPHEELRILMPHEEL